MCRMVAQSYERGACDTLLKDGTVKPACQATLRREGAAWYRLIEAAHLSRPEDYFSIYQSGCNHACLKCYSASFTQVCSGFWVSTSEIAEMVTEYESMVTVWEPRERATMFHASNLCHHYGLCVTSNSRGFLCPGKLSPDQVTLNVQGWGPARNIVAFTGGDLVCNAEFYAQAAEQIKKRCKKM